MDQPDELRRNRLSVPDKARRTRRCIRNAPDWTSTRLLGHIDKVSRELAAIEVALEESNLDEAVFADLLAGRMS